MLKGTLVDNALLTITIAIVSNSQIDDYSRLPNEAYCVDRRGSGNDFELGLGPDQAVEIMTFGSIDRRE